MLKECAGIACAHLSCGAALTTNAVNLGRREFLKESAATAGFAGLLLAGCETSPAQGDAGPADTIVTNAKIATLNPRQPSASAIAVRGGEIAGIGSAADVEKLRGPATRVIDAG